MDDEGFAHWQNFPGMDTEPSLAVLAVEGDAVIWAAFVKGFAHFHATVKDVVSKFSRGDILMVSLGRLESTLDLLASMIKDVKRLDCPPKKIRSLIKEMKMVDEWLSRNDCSSCSSNHSRIDMLVSKIVEFCLFDLQILPTIGQQMHCPQFGIEGTSISFFFCVCVILLHNW